MSSYCANMQLVLLLLCGSLLTYAVTVSKQCSSLVPFLENTVYPCGWWFNNMCARYSASYKETDVCCENYIENDDGETCSAVCDSPCENGECIGWQTCACKPGFTGTHCEYDIDECQADPCPDGYHCLNTMGSYVCRENVYRRCDDLGCSHHAVCVNTTDMISCECIKGYSGDGFSCHEIRCGALTDPTNGRVNVTGGYSYGSIAVFTCSGSHTLVGSSEIYCEFSGSWSTHSPACLPGCTKKCAENASCINYSNRERCVCHTGFDGNGDTSCTEVLCPELTVPVNGSIEHSDGRGDYDEVHFTCSPGFRLKGSAILTCRAHHGKPDGTWSDLVPTCEDPCSPKCSQGAACVVTQQGGKCECEEGYIVSGSRCEIVKCPVLSAPINGSPTSIERQYRTVMDFQCDNGFYQPNPSSIICSKNGTWLGTIPSCERIPCNISRITTPANGSVKHNQNLQEIVTVTFSCNAGFQLKGQDSLLCLPEGKWTGYSPSCQASHCPHINSVRHGKVTGDKNSPGDTVTFQCDSGYTLEGPQAVTCNDTGYWNDSLPHCKRTGQPDCSNATTLIPPGTGATLNCTSSGSSHVKQNECIIVCGGNRTYQAAHFNRHVCDEETIVPGWLVSTNIGLRDIELGTCVEPILPLMALSVEGIIAEVSIMAQHAELSTCLREILNHNCSGNCQTSDMQIEVLSSHLNQQFVAIGFTLSQTPRTGGNPSLDQAEQEWTDAITHLQLTVDSLQEAIDAGSTSSCSTNTSFGWTDGEILRGSPELDCPPGHAIMSPNCYPCPEGTFHDRDIRRCEPCPIGYYQPQPSSAECVRCPTGTTTAKEGTKSKSSCLAFADCNCGEHSCILSDSGYSCQCKPGFSQDGTRTCTDIDECEKPVCGVTSHCFNLPGSYVCVCQEGYIGEGCEDIDECHFPDICPPGYTCENTPGSYRCICKDNGAANCTGTP